MSAEGEAIRSNDYRKDTTVKAPSARPAAVLGLDVGKSSHWACLIDRDGEVLASAPVRNREAELDALFASAPAGTLVVVDQFRNIGSLAVRRARAAGLGVAYLPGLAASRAAGLFAGEAKTDERDAAVIARTALGVPDSLSGVPGRGEALEAARALSSQRDHVVACATRDKNRLRAVLLESCPALEAAVDGFGGAWGIARSGAEGPRAEAAGEAAAASTAPPPALVEAENRQVRFLAARISEALDEAGALEAETAALLEGDETYACLLTVPGIGPRTAAQLAVSVDIGRFPDHDHLASYCGIAPRVRSSGTSVRSVRASRRGDARLKSLLIFSCNSLVRSSGRYGEYYRACRARGMGHGRALKAVARKRLRAIYAVMRDRVPYRE
uniref:IS110 family transposase n=1 Tax=Collinsella sp. TaxID=1965294 RepID=UPI00402890C3